MGHKYNDINREERVLALYPFLPFSSEKLNNMLGFDENVYEIGWQWDQSISALPPGQKLVKPYPLYKKLEDDLATEEIRKLKSVEREEEGIRKLIERSFFRQNSETPLPYPHQIPDNYEFTIGIVFVVIHLKKLFTVIFQSMMLSVCHN